MESFHGETDIVPLFIVTNDKVQSGEPMSLLFSLESIGGLREPQSSHTIRTSHPGMDDNFSTAAQMGRSFQ